MVRTREIGTPMQRSYAMGGLVNIYSIFLKWLWNLRELSFTALVPRLSLRYKLLYHHTNFSLRPGGRLRRTVLRVNFVSPPVRRGHKIFYLVKNIFVLNDSIWAASGGGGLVADAIFVVLTAGSWLARRNYFWFVLSDRKYGLTIV